MQIEITQYSYFLRKQKQKSNTNDASVGGVV